VQVDPINTTLKAPGTKRLKLNYDAPRSSFAFNFDVRRYTVERQLQEITRTLVGPAGLLPATSSHAI
jgi:hypothetical protein